MRWTSLFIVSAFLLVTSTAQAEYFTITHFHIQVTFNQKGEAEFEEVIEVLFSEPRHGIFRFIPLRSVIHGKQVDRIIKDIQVEGFKKSTYKENNNLVIKIGDADTYVDGRQVYKIRYRVLNPLNFFEEHAEFYWDLTGIAWPVEIAQASFHILFPEKVNLTAADVYTYTGAAGSTSSHLSLDIRARAVEGHSTQRFAAYEGMTAAIRITGGVFEPMSTWEVLKEKFGLVLAALLFVFGGLLARFTARNQRVTIMTEYFPPEGLSPAVAGGFVDHSVDNNDVLCLIPHLANLGYLRLEVKEGGFLRKNDITLYKLKPSGQDLFAFEQQFFDALFASGDQVRIKDLKDKFYIHMSAVKTSVKEWIKQQGWYEPDQKAMGCVTGIGGLAALAWGAYAVFGQQNLVGFALIIAGIVLFFFAGGFNKRSPRGNDTYRQLEGFRQFVKKAERPVIERLMKEDPLYYDKTMPFALAFGYLRQWNRQFEGLLTQPPTWYSGPGMHGGDLSRSWSTFSESFPSEINSIGSVFSSSPSSSSSGGGGGGSSGGGSGGGGGGSW